MNTRLIAAAAAIMISLPSTTSAQVLRTGPFSGVDLSPLSADQRRTIIEATEDFQAVLLGREPVHAQFDKHAPVPSDGGTTFYIGHKYKLTIESSLSSFGSLSGWVYGPIVVFDEAFAHGNENTFSGVHFYTQAGLPKLRSRH
jgi:hypothetical protein